MYYSKRLDLAISIYISMAFPQNIALVANPPFEFDV
jgi:hypothetical protein